MGLIIHSIAKLNKSVLKLWIKIYFGIVLGDTYEIYFCYGLKYEYYLTCHSKTHWLICACKSEYEEGNNTKLLSYI